MRSLFFSLVVAALIGCGGGSSTTASTTSNPETQNSGGETTVATLAEFTSAMTQAALPDLCGNPEAFTRSCFTVDEPTCGRAFEAAMQGCADHAEELQLPQTVTETNAEATARTLAQCASQAYAIGLNQIGMMLQTPECQPNAQ